MTSPSVLEPDFGEGRYNARDVLGMCRIYAPLVEALQRRGTIDVYQMDKKMAHLARQMRRIGMPIDPDAREAVRKRLTERRDAAAAQLLPYTQGEYWEAFLSWVVTFKALTVRKDDPGPGSENPDLGAPHSAESAFAARKAIREQEFLKEWEKAGKRVNLNSRDQAAALLRGAGVPLLQPSEKSPVPSLGKEIMEELRHYPAARAFREWNLTAKTLTNNVENLVVDEHGCIHPDWEVHKITGRFGSSPNCFDGATEVLTRAGWVRFDHYVPGTAVAQFDPKTAAVSFVKPTAYIRREHHGELVRLHRRNVDLLLTPDHRLLLYGIDDAPRSVLADDAQAYVRSKLKFKTAGDFAFGAERHSKAFVQLLCALQADATPNGSGWTLRLTRPRKIARLREILQALRVPYSTKETQEPNPFKKGAARARTMFYVQKCTVGDTAYKLLGSQKLWGPWLLRWSRQCILWLLDEIMHWDGSYTRRNCYASSQRTNADWIQTLCVLTGRRARVRQYMASPIQKQPNWQVDICTRVHTGITNTIVERERGRRIVYCVSVPKDAILVRRGGNVLAIHQCQNWSKRAGGGAENLREMVRAPEGHVFVIGDYAQLEARLIGAMAACKYLIDIFARDGDLHAEISGTAYGHMWDEVDAIYREHAARNVSCGDNPADPKSKCASCKQRAKLRDNTKRLEYGGVFYGGTPETVYTAVVKDVPDLQLELVRQFCATMAQATPEIGVWHNSLIQSVVENHEIRSPFLGRRELFPMGRAETTVVYNFPAQSGGADLWALGASQFMDEYDQSIHPNDGGCRIFHNGHDSVGIWCREEDGPKMAEVMRRCWERELNGVHFKIEPEIVRRWSEAG